MIRRRRHAILAILFCAYLLCYMDRMVMASAIPFIAKEFHLSPLEMGGVLSAFFIGYAVMQLPGGLLADRFGPNRVMTASIVSWSIFTTLTGTASSLTALLIIRVLFGLSEGPFPATASKTVATWFPSHEIGRANGLQLAAVNIGAAIAPLLVAPLIIHLGWRSVFYCLLLPGLILALLARTLVQDKPAQSDQVNSRLPSVAGQAGIREVLQTPAVIWCATSLFFVNIVGWGLMNWLPTYLLQARGLSISRMGVGTALPFLAGAAGYFIGGYISDKYFNERRRIPIVVGLVIASAMTYWAAIAPSSMWAIAALMLAFLFLSVASAGLFTLPLLVVPRAVVGGAFGFVNTIGQIAAFLSPLLVGYVLGVTGGNFTIVFYGFVALFLVGACVALQIRQPQIAPQ